MSGEERSDEWKVISYAGKRNVRGVKRAQKRVSLNSRVEILLSLRSSRPSLQLSLVALPHLLGFPCPKVPDLYGSVVTPRRKLETISTPARREDPLGVPLEVLDIFATSKIPDQDTPSKVSSCNKGTIVMERNPISFREVTVLEK